MALVNPLSLPAVEAEMATASYSLTTTSWESVGVTLALPAAGRWLILGSVRAQLRTTVGSAAMSFRLYDTTAGAAFAKSEVTGTSAISTGITYPATTTIAKQISVTVPSTVDLQAITPAGPTYGPRDLYSDTDGRTLLTAIYLGPN